jgi:hypothetical protein
VEWGEWVLELHCFDGLLDDGFGWIERGSVMGADLPEGRIKPNPEACPSHLFSRFS